MPTPAAVSLVMLTWNYARTETSALVPGRHRNPRNSFANGSQRGPNLLTLGR